MRDAIAALMAFSTWTVLCLIGGWQALRFWQFWQVKQMVRRRTQETARQYAVAQAERRQAAYAKARGMQA